MALTNASEEELQRIISSLKAEISQLEKSEVDFEALKNTSMSIESDILEDCESTQSGKDAKDAYIRAASKERKTLAAVSGIEIVYSKEMPLKDDIILLTGEGKAQYVSFTFEIHLKEACDKTEIVNLNCKVSEPHAAELKDFTQECEKSRNMIMFIAGIKGYSSLFYRRHSLALFLAKDHEKHIKLKKNSKDPGFTVDVFDNDDVKMLTVTWILQWSYVYCSMVEDFKFGVDRDSVFNSPDNKKVLEDVCNNFPLSHIDVVRFWNKIIAIVSSNPSSE